MATSPVLPTLRPFGICALLLCLSAPGRLTAADPPKGLDAKRLEEIVSALESGNARFDWPPLAKAGGEVLPYFEHILASAESTNDAIDGALTFARLNLQKYDCKRLVDPAAAQLTNHLWGVRAEVMLLLEKIGGREDCVAVAVLLDADSHYNRMGAGELLATLGGRRELLALELWLSRRSADAGGDRDTKDAFAFVKKSRDKLRERLEKGAKGQPVEASVADKTVDQFADADPKVRAGAVAALEKVGGRADSSAVVTLLHDPDAKVRVAAAEWLGAVGGKRELLALEIRLREPKATDDDAFDAVKKARDALRERVEAEERKPKAKPADPKGEKKDDKK